MYAYLENNNIANKYRIQIWSNENTTLMYKMSNLGTQKNTKYV